MAPKFIDILLNLTEDTDRMFHISSGGVRGGGGDLLLLVEEEKNVFYFPLCLTTWSLCCVVCGLSAASCPLHL